MPTAPDRPVVLTDDDLVLRGLRRRDRRRWRTLLATNERWLAPWMAGSPVPARPMTYAEQLASARQATREGTGLSFVVELAGDLVGAVTAQPIARGASWTASVGYWVSEHVAGRGITPRAVALVVDHLFDELGIHRVEIDVRPENDASLRVVDKLGFVEEGRRRGLMFVDGDWRDHRSFALLTGDLGRGPGAVLRTLGRASTAGAPVAATEELGAPGAEAPGAPGDKDRRDR